MRLKPTREENVAIDDVREGTQRELDTAQLMVRRPLYNDY